MSLPEILAPNYPEILTPNYMEILAGARLMGPKGSCLWHGRTTTGPQKCFIP